jgi:hypothetical protein
MKKCLSICAFLTVLLVGFGCDKSAASQKRAKVSGTVNLEGKPLLTGNITFDTKNGEAPASFNIVDGKFEGMAPVGKNFVSITSFRKTSMKEKMKMDGPGYDQPIDENILPARYSTDSKLEKEVTEKGPNDFTFDLKKD